MNKIIRITITVFILIQLVTAPISLAYENIKLVAGEESKNEIICNQDEKMVLKQDWYGMKFELSTLQRLGVREIKEVDSNEYQKALDEVRFPLELIGDYKVYFLNYKLNGDLNARALSFMDNSVVVFGTYWNMDKAGIHNLAVHELGHQIDFKLMNQEKWNSYIKLRAIENQIIYNNNSEFHYNRPQEIFAEDFRSIFGGEEARNAPHVNSALKNPNEVEGLKEFFLSLVNVN